MALRRPQTHYARSGETAIAYQVTGDGPLDLVYVPGFISHIEYEWEDPHWSRYYQRLAAFSRLIRLDKRGTGLSVRSAGIATMEERMDAEELTCSRACRVNGACLPLIQTGHERQASQTRLLACHIAST